MKNAMLVAGYRDEKLISKRAKDALTLVDMERYKNKLSDAAFGRAATESGYRARIGKGERNNFRG